MCLHCPQSGQNSFWLFQLKSVFDADVIGGHLPSGSAMDSTEKARAWESVRVLDEDVRVSSWLISLIA